MELMVQKYMNANDGDETYVRVPASKEFYVFSTSVIEPDRASVGGLWARCEGTDIVGASQSKESWIAAGRDKHRTKADAQRYGAAPIAA